MWKIFHYSVRRHSAKMSSESWFSFGLEKQMFFRFPWTYGMIRVQMLRSVQKCGFLLFFIVLDSILAAVNWMQLVDCHCHDVEHITFFEAVVQKIVQIRTEFNHFSWHIAVWYTANGIVKKEIIRVWLETLIWETSCRSFSLLCFHFTLLWCSFNIVYTLFFAFIRFEFITFQGIFTYKKRK